MLRESIQSGFVCSRAPHHYEVKLWELPHPGGSPLPRHELLRAGEGVAQGVPQDWDGPLHCSLLSHLSYNTTL